MDSGDGEAKAVIFLVAFRVTEGGDVLGLNAVSGLAGTVDRVQVDRQFSGPVGLDSGIAPVQHPGPGGLGIRPGPAEAGPHGVDEHGDALLHTPGLQRVHHAFMKAVVSNADLHHDQIIAVIQMGLEGGRVGAAVDEDVKDAFLNILGGNGIVRMGAIPDVGRGLVPLVHGGGVP